MNLFFFKFHCLIVIARITDREYNLIMKCEFVVFVAILVASCCWGAQGTYKPAEMLAAGDAYVPYQVITDGLFILDVSLDDKGTVLRGIDALRDPGAMLTAARTTASAWKFQPASKDGKDVASRMTLSLVYRPPSNGSAGAVPPKNFPPVIPPNDADANTGVATFRWG